MISVTNNSINGIILGTKKQDVDLDSAKSQELKLEFNNSDNLVTISTRLKKQFLLNGTEVDFEKIHRFLSDENPLLDGDFFIFENHNLSLYVDFENKIFLEILLYHESLKDNYEQRATQRYHDQKID